ncbi:MAG: RNA-binding protein [Xanthobacteraceae bacterium]
MRRRWPSLPKRPSRPLNEGNDQRMTVEAQTIETDAGPRSRIGPDRLCVATRSVRPLGDLIRFVAGPQGLVPDLKRKLPGRGVWVTAHQKAVADAVARGAFKKSLKSDVTVPADLVQLVDRLLVRAALDALAIAYKAGEAICGYAKVEAAIAAGEAAALLHASDASDDGVQKLFAAVKRKQSEELVNLPRIRTFTSSDLDLAFGRANVIHAALLAGRAGETFLARWRDLERFRSNEFDTDSNIETGAPTSAPRELGME